MNGPCYWIARGSFFWSQLQKLRPLFNWSTIWSIGSGEGISFWQDSWGGIAISNSLEARPSSPYISLRDAVPVMEMVAPDYVDDVVGVVFSQARDVIKWKWETNRLYSAKSVYATIMGGGKIRDRYAQVWKARVPPTVKIFGFLMLKNRLLTHDNMQHRSMYCAMQCVLCENCPIESEFHIFFLCPYVVHVWYILSNKAGVNLISLKQDLNLTWEASIGNIRSRGDQWKRKALPLFLCTVWETWKQRNAKVFSGTRMAPLVLANKIWFDAEQWMAYC